MMRGAWCGILKGFGEIECGAGGYRIGEPKSMLWMFFSVYSVIQLYYIYSMQRNGPRITRMKSI